MKRKHENGLENTVAFFGFVDGIMMIFLLCVKSGTKTEKIKCIYICTRTIKIT